jgi:hypothetical protein
VHVFEQQVFGLLRHGFIVASAALAVRLQNPSGGLVIPTPRLDRLIARLHSPSDPSELRATLAEFDTVLVE